MSKAKYNGSFSSRDEVIQNFENAWGDVPRDRAKTYPTERQILYASYDTPPYEGDAFVVFERDGKVYEVCASHCSCRGLEGQWTPEETSWAALAIRKFYSGHDSPYWQRLIKRRLAKAEGR